MGTSLSCLPVPRQMSISVLQEKRRLREELFGPMSTLPYEEACAIFQTTGLDLGEKRKQVMDHSSMVEKGVKRLITFAKSIPGFKELPMNDQIGLIKSKGESDHDSIY